MRWLAGAFLVLLSLSLYAAGCSSEQSGIDGTRVLPYMQAEIAPGENVVYCLSFQIAWNQLVEKGKKGDDSDKNKPPIARFLSESLSTKDDISEDCYVAMAGKRRDDIVAKINEALKAKFGDEAPVVKESLQIEDTALAYAYMYKNLKFEKEFEGLDAPIAFESSAGTTNVAAFGIQKYSSGKHKELGKQVEVIEYKDDSEFIIRLKSAGSEDDIILAKVEPQDTLLETVEAVQKRAGKPRAWQLGRGDTLQIPKFDFDITRYYDELKKVYYLIEEAMQRVCFRLDEKGAVLKSEAGIVQAPEEHGRPRHFVFDRPFLLYLKKKDAKYPYFAMWVENTELMVKK